MSFLMLLLFATNVNSSFSEFSFRLPMARISDYSNIIRVCHCLEFMSFRIPFAIDVDSRIFYAVTICRWREFASFSILFLFADSLKFAFFSVLFLFAADVNYMSFRIQFLFADNVNSHLYEPFFRSPLTNSISAYVFKSLKLKFLNAAMLPYSIFIGNEYEVGGNYVQVNST